MTTGTVKFFNAEKGYGFIKKEDGNDIFFHVSEVQGARELQENDQVEFEVGEGKKGPCAVQVSLKK